MFLFSNCINLTKVGILSRIKEMPYCCFEHCSNLKEVELPKNIKFEPKCFTCCKSLSEKSKKNISEEFTMEIKPKYISSECYKVYPDGRRIFTGYM